MLTEYIDRDISTVLSLFDSKLLAEIMKALPPDFNEWLASHNVMKMKQIARYGVANNPGIWPVLVSMLVAYNLRGNAVVCPGKYVKNTLPYNVIWDAFNCSNGTNSHMLCFYVIKMSGISSDKFMRILIRSRINIRRLLLWLFTYAEYIIHLSCDS